MSGKFSFLPFFFLFTLSLHAAPPGTFQADGPKTKRAVSLTFDDGPGENTRKVMDILEKQGVKATFFMNGDQVAIRPAIAKEVLSRGHEIADHTYSHANFYAFEKKQGADKTRELARSEMKKSREAIEKATGFSPVLCRMPNGYHRPWLKDVAKEFNYALVNWTFGQDWLNVPEEKMAEGYVKALRPGSILLFHDGGRNRQKTLNILPKVIAEAQKKNLAIVPVGELLSE